MKKHRIIPVLLLRNGFLVQSKEFKRYQNLGNPITAVKRLSEWGSDELIYLDITRDDNYDMRRDDLGHPNRNNLFDIIADVSKEAWLPVTVGGRIRTLEDIEKRLSLGADKIAINTMPLEDPAFEWDLLMKEADQRLYRAKHEGRNRVVSTAPDIATAT